MPSVLSDLFQVRTVLITVLLSSSVSVPGCRQNKGASKSFKMHQSSCGNNQRLSPIPEEKQWPFFLLYLFACDVPCGV